jgi:glycosyltransferase involved in cell wall biosynthesis
MIGEGNRRIDWKGNVLNADEVVAFCPFGQRNINKMAGREASRIHIPHGVDAEAYKPGSADEKWKARREHFPMLPPDAFLIGFFSRNQPRKAIDKLLHAISIFQHEHEDPDRPVYVYMHCAFDDKVGWNIPALANFFNLKRDRMLRDKKIGIGIGIPDELLRNRYIACDVTALPTRGEGWWLTILESMACGVPVLTSKYSAHVDCPSPTSKDA